MDEYLKTLNMQALLSVMAQWAKAQAWYDTRYPEDSYMHQSLERALCAGEKRLCHGR